VACCVRCASVHSYPVLLVHPADGDEASSRLEVPNQVLDRRPVLVPESDVLECERSSLPLLPCLAELAGVYREEVGAFNQITRVFRHVAPVLGDLF
jgi:hypothetical protein